MNQNVKIYDIVSEAQLKILKETGQDVILQVLNKSDYNYMQGVCDMVCGYWGITLDWLSEHKRSEDRPIMKKVLWMVLKEHFPKAPYLHLALIVGHKNHAGVHHGIKAAKMWHYVKDESFMKYYEPVKHLINGK